MVSLPDHQPPVDEEGFPAYFDSPRALLMHTFEQEPKDESRVGDPVAFYVAFGSALVLVVTTWNIILSNHPKALEWLSLHAILNSFALLSFVFGILTLQPTSQPKTKASGFQRHQIAMLSGLSSVLVGSSAMIYFKASHHAAHFTTWHGTLGLITLCWLFAQSVVGAGSVWFGGALFGGGLKAKLVWKYHRLSGYILLILLLTTIYLGGTRTTFIPAHSSFAVRVIAYILAPIFILISIYSRVRPSKMNFF